MCTFSTPSGHVFVSLEPVSLHSVLLRPCVLTLFPNYYELEQPGANIDKLILFRWTMYKVTSNWSNKCHVTEIIFSHWHIFYCLLE